MGSKVPRCVVVGGGRAGGSFVSAFAAAGWHTDDVGARSLLDRAADHHQAVATIRDADLVLLTVPDAVISDVARRLHELTGGVPGVVAHVSGACGLDVLAPHHRVASIHPLMSLPDAETGGRRLLDGCSFAIDGDPIVDDVVAMLGGRALTVAPGRRAAYHAAAAVASNHLTALCSQVEQLAASAGVPVAAYWTLVQATFDNVVEQGAAAALTGPASRADWSTVRSHLEAIPIDERGLYLCLCERAAALAGHEVPRDLAELVSGERDD